MKILIVIDSIGTGGAQKLKAELAIGLANTGYCVEMFIYNKMTDEFFASDLLNAGIIVHIANKKRSGFSINVLRELRILLEKDYDVVISSMHAPSIYASLAVIGNKKCKLIVCDESSSLAPISLFRRGLFYLATLIADYVVPNSFSEAALMKKLPGRSKKVYPIWNGYDLSPMPFYSNQNNKNKGVRRLLIVGRIAYPKNGVNLLRALALFLSRNGWLPKIHWVGRLDSDIKSLNMKVEMDSFLSLNPGVDENWIWEGVVNDVNDYYRTSDALLHVSIYEGLPNVICEAMLSGCFVIASNVCDHPLIIGKNERGMLCEPNSPESICIAIEKLNQMESKKKLEVLRKARSFAEYEFNRDIMIEKYVSLFYEKNK